MPPSRSDRWQAKFRRNFAQSDSDYGQSRRTAGLLPGVQPIFFYGNGYFLRNIDFHAEALNRTDYICYFIRYVL